MNVPEPKVTSQDVNREYEAAQIQEALRGLRYGNVNIVVQDGVIVQIDRTEKRRLRVADTVRENHAGR